MEMASFCLKIRHVFGFTSLTERSIGAGPPVIIQLSGYRSPTQLARRDILNNPRWRNKRAKKNAGNLFPYKHISFRAFCEVLGCFEVF